MSTLLLLTSALQPSAEVLPGLALLGHQVKILPAEGSALLEAPDSDLRARRRPPGPRPRPRPVPADPHHRHRRARCCWSSPRAASPSSPTTGAWTTSSCTPAARPSSRPGSSWPSAGWPPQREAADPEAHVIRSGEVVVDDATYTAKIGGRTLDLTFKEFELLKFLAQHPGRVFSRQQLLQEVWGYDYFGGTRTVDVHVRRLRAKLGPENETLIGTVRNVGYRFVLPAKEPASQEPRRGPSGGAGRSESSEGRRDGVSTSSDAWPRRDRSRRRARPPSRDGRPRPARRGRPAARSSTTGWPTPRSGWPATTASRCVHDGALDLAVAPGARGRGLGGELAADGAGRRRAGDRLVARRPPRGARAGRAARLRRARELWVMRRPTAEPLPGSSYPPASTVRGYRDDDARRGARGQRGGVRRTTPSRGDGRRRPRRADGRAVVRPGRAAASPTRRRRLLGFHWTKRHAAELGEVYVVGDRPGRAGPGLGRLLTLAGLHHLRGRGVAEVLLYVESDNAPAVARLLRDSASPTRRRHPRACTGGLTA